MSSIMVRSSTTDITETGHDRYTIAETMDDSFDDDDDEYESQYNSSRHERTIISESTYSGTYGTTSYMSEMSEVLDEDASFIDDDDDYLSLGSEAMVGDGWVDTACGCLDRPVSTYQNMCSRKQTSLLRHSRGKPRPNFNQRSAVIPTSKLTMSAKKRRNFRLKDRSVCEHGERGIEDVEDSDIKTDAGRSDEIKMMRIQPRESYQLEDDFDVRKVRDTEKTRNKNSSKSMKVKREEAAVSHNDEDEPNVKQEDRPEKASEKKMVPATESKTEDDPVIKNIEAPPPMERGIEADGIEISAQMSGISTRDRSVKRDPPTESEAVATREGQPADDYPENYSNLEAPASQVEGEERSKDEVASEEDVTLPSPPSFGDKITSGLETNRNDNVSPIPVEEISRNPSDMVVLSSTSQNEDFARTPSNENQKEVGDGASTSNNIEIIDVLNLSIDDEDSWTPVARHDVEKGTATGKNSNEFSRRSMNSNRALHPMNSPSMEERWIEEEAKLMQKVKALGLTNSRPQNHTVMESAEDVWNEERMKLHKPSDDIFDDPKAREAFLDRRQGRLRDAVMISRNKMLSKNGTSITDSLDGVGKQVFPRSQSTGRNPPPSPEMRTKIMQSRSSSRDRITRNRSMDPGSASLLPSRSKDLVAVRSIEEGQRMRSSNRASNKQRTFSNSHDPIVVHSYVGDTLSRGPYDELQGRNQHSRTTDRRNRPSTPSRSRSTSIRSEPIVAADLTNVDYPMNSHRFSDERDDQESLTTANPNSIESSQTNVFSASEKLLKLEQKIERQLRQVRGGVQEDLERSREIRRIESKLSQKLKSFRTDDADLQTLSSRDIKRLEKQLAQKLSGDNEKRASRLKKIKRRGVSSARSHAHSSGMLTDDEQQLSLASSAGRDRAGSAEVVTTPSGKSLSRRSRRSQESRSEKSKYQTLQGLRSRYVRRGYSRMPETD